MAEPRFDKEQNPNDRIKQILFNKSFELNGLGIPTSIKSEDQPPKDNKPQKAKPPKNEFEKWVRQWKIDDPLPIVPPGKKIVLDAFPGLGIKKPRFYVDAEPPRKRSINEIGLIESKSVLGQTIGGMPGVSKLIAMVAKRRGIPVDDQGKLRCPAGTPAANQFTDLQMSNCLVPSAATVAGDVADVVGRKIRGAVGGGRTNIPSFDRDIVNDPDGVKKIFGTAENALRFLSFKKRHAYQKKIVNQQFGNVRDVNNAAKALKKAFPNMDEKSIKKFLADYGDLNGKDLLDYLDAREAFLTSMLYESLKNPEAAKALIVWEWKERLGDNGNDGFVVEVDVTDGMPYVSFSYNPRLFMQSKYSMDDDPDTHADWLGMGRGNSPEEIASAKDWGAYVGGHEFGHLADFYARFKRAGLEVDDTNARKPHAYVESLIQSTGKDLATLLADGDITVEQEQMYAVTADLLYSFANASTDKEKDDAVITFYDRVANILLQSTGLPGWLDDQIPDLVGSGYANIGLTQETHAEAYKVFSSIPEIVQQRIDELNKTRVPRGDRPIPPVNELSEMMFGVDVTGMRPDTEAPKPGFIRRVSRGVGAAARPGGDDDSSSISTITEEAADDFIRQTEENINNASNIRKETARRNILDGLFKYYSPEEIEEIMSRIPESLQTDNGYIASQLRVPKKISNLRKPNGTVHSAEHEWNNLLAVAMQNDWVDFTSVTDAHTLRGGKGPVRTILADAKEKRRLINQARANRAARRQAAKSSQKLSGSMSTSEKPSYPREPTYGAFLGSANELFDGVSTWEEFAEKYKDQEIVFFDYETTGLEFDEFRQPLSKGAPVQFGAVKVKNGKVVDRINLFMNPEQPLGEWSRANLKDRDGNLLTDEWLQTQPSVADAHRQLIEFAGPGAVFGVQNAAFDKDVLDGVLTQMGEEWQPAGYIDTREIAALTLPKWTPETDDGPFVVDRNGNKKPSSSLAAITEYLDVKLGEGHHNADADAEATSEVMQKIIDGAIEKNWSKDVLDRQKRDKINQDSVDKFNAELEQFEANKRAFLSGSMSAGTQRSVELNDLIARDIENLTDFYNDDRLTTDMTENARGLITKESVDAIRLSLDEMPELSQEQKEQLKDAVEKRGVGNVRSDILALASFFGPKAVRQQFKDDNGVIVHNGFYGPGLPLAIEKELAIASGDIDKAKKIDAFINYLRTASQEEMVDDLIKSANDFGDGFDRRIAVFIKEPQKFIDSGIYYTQFDIEAREQAGIRSTTGSGTDVRSQRRNAESTYGIPDTLADRMRPASGVIQQRGLANGRRRNLKSKYGDDVSIAEDYTIGKDVDRSSNVGAMYGANQSSSRPGGRIILKPHIADRSRFTSSDSMAYRGSDGVEMASSESLRNGASALGFAKGDAKVGLLYHSMVDEGLSLLSPSVGTGTSGYSEALIPGSFSMDDVAAIVINDEQFGRQGREVGALIRENGSMTVGVMRPTVDSDARAFSEFLDARQRLIDEHGATLILDAQSLGGLDEVELFNPQMTSTFVRQIKPQSFPYIEKEDINNDSTVADMILLNHLRALEDGKTSNTSFSENIENQLKDAAEKGDTEKFKSLLEEARLETIEMLKKHIDENNARTAPSASNRTLRGSMSSPQKTGTISVSEKSKTKPYKQIDIETIDNLGNPIDSIDSRDIFPVYSIGNKKIAFGSSSFGNQKIELEDDVELVSLNPFEISNTSPESKEGKENAIKWWNATSYLSSVEPDNVGIASALLYASTRGDSEAERELTRLADLGAQARQQKSDDYFEDLLKSFDGYDFLAPSQYTDNEHLIFEKDGRRAIETKDLFMVHQTSYQPTVDADGNLILRPLEDFGDGRKDDSDGPLRFHRASLHFSLNHLVHGHIGRQSPTGKTYAVILNFDSTIKNNQDSLDNLLGVDTVMTPPPGQGLKIPAGSYRLVELPSMDDLGLKPIAYEDMFNPTDEERKYAITATETFREAQNKVVQEMLEQLGVEANGENYKTRIFPGGEHGTTNELDTRIRYIAALMKVKSRPHNSMSAFSQEKLSVFNKTEDRQISQVANEKTWELSINAMLRLVNGDRFTTGVTERQPTTERQTPRSKW